MGRRWDIDQRERGVADAVPFRPAVHLLLEKMRQPDWVAEDPEHHLLPAIQRACRERDTALRIDDASTDDRGILVVNLSRGMDTPRELRAEVFAIIGYLAESSTHVRMVETGDAVECEVTTGMMPSDSEFAGHGHTLLLRVH